jgi:TolA-binding protein
MLESIAMSDTRITRKDIKQQDEFLTSATQLLQWGMQRRKMIGLILLIIVALGSVLAGVSTYRGRQEQNGAALLAVALRVYNSPVTADETTESAAGDEHSAAGHQHFATREAKYEAAIGALEPIIQEYGAYPSGQTAAFYLGASYAAIDRAEEAEQALRRAAQSSAPFVKAMAMHRLGVFLLEQDRADDAVEVFEELARQPPAGFPVEQALAGEARAHEAQGDPQAAMLAYQRIAEDYPASVYAVEARTRAEELAAELGVELDAEG